MTRVLTNNTQLASARESTVGTLPGSPQWVKHEPNSYGRIGAEVTKTPRTPISKSRQRRKGTPTALTSGVEFNEDLTMSSVARFIESFVFAEFANLEFNLQKTSGTLPPSAAATTNLFTVDSVTALLAGKIAYNATGAVTLLHGRGYTNSANNGLHAVNAAVSASDTTIEVASSLVTETPPTNAELVICGVRTTDNDLTLTVSGSTATLVSAAKISNWATLGVQVGQLIHIGSATTSGAVQNAMKASVADDVYGFARVTSISGATLNLDKLGTALASSTNNGTGVADIMFSQFARNVDVDADSDDERYLERSHTFEISYPDLGGVGTDKYEYPEGNYANEMALNFPLEDKATIDFGFVGTDTPVPTTTRATNASSAKDPLKTTALNTSSNIVSLTTDVVSAASDVCFKSLTLRLGNGVTPESCLGTFGASFVNAGNFEVSLSGQMLFTDSAITSAVRNNTTITFLAVVANADGGVAFDIPAMTLGDGSKDFPVGQSVLVNIQGEAHKDDDLGTSLGVSFFPNVPFTAA